MTVKKIGLDGNLYVSLGIQETSKVPVKHKTHDFEDEKLPEPTKKKNAKPSEELKEVESGHSILLRFPKPKFGQKKKVVCDGPDPEAQVPQQPLSYGRFLIEEMTPPKLWGHENYTKVPYVPRPMTPVIHARYEQPIQPRSFNF